MGSPKIQKAKTSKKSGTLVRRAEHWLGAIAHRERKLFVHWKYWNTTGDE